MVKTAIMNKWEDMNGDILGLIIRRLGFEDFDAFASVCSPWWSLARQEIPNFRLRRLPWLMLVDRNGTVSREFYVLYRQMVIEIPLPELKERKCLSSLGWILTIDKRGGVDMINPFGACPATIKLPSLDRFRSEEDSGIDFYPEYVRKFALSANPSSSAEYAVMILADSKAELGFWRPGDEGWTVVESSNAANFDVIHYKGRFVVLDCTGRVMVCDFGNGRRPVKAEVVLEMSEGLLRKGFMEEGYLVELDGMLLLVSREGSVSREPNEEARTYGFQVFKADIEGGTWTEVRDLGDSSIFIGYNSSFSLRIVEGEWVKPNCIYFTEDYFVGYYFKENGGGKDMGIYHLEDGRVESLNNIDSCCFITPPLWLEPTYSL